MSSQATVASTPTPTDIERGRLAALWGLCIALACIVLRCISTYDPFPYWSGDPFIMPSPVVGLTPAWAMGLDAVTIIACGVVCWGVSRAASNLQLRLLIDNSGVILFVYSAVSLTTKSFLDDHVLGLHWGASVFVALAVLMCIKDRALRLPAAMLACAALLSIVVMIVPKGLAQVFVEHPQMMRTFRANQDAFLAAQGWSPDSAMARGYLRRLEQPEASGWFGLANVFATLAAAGFATFITWLVLELTRERIGVRDDRTERTKLLAITGGGAALCAAGVWLAGSKGGFAVAGLGLVLAGAAWWIRRPGNESRISAKVAGWIGPALVALTLLAVIVRGLIGERISELSILFRWFYMQGAAKIFIHNPFGVGPAGFKDAYMIHKPALSPEDTAFAHSILIDWIVCAGVIGLVLVGVWVGFLMSASRGLLRPAPASSPSDAGPEESPEERSLAGTLLRQARGLACLMVILPTGIAAFLEREAATPESGLTRAAGIAFALACIWGIWRVIERGSRTQNYDDALGPAVAVGAVVAAVHCQIELTGTTQGSGAWCWLALACGAGLCRGAWVSPSLPDALDQNLSPTFKLPRWIVIPIAALPIFILGGVVAMTWSWQYKLARAYGPADEVREFVQRRSELDQLSGAARDQAGRALLDDLSAATGQTVTSGTLEATLGRVQEQGVAAAKDALVLAASDEPWHFGTLRAASRVLMIEAQGRIARGEKLKPADLDAAITLLDKRREQFGKTASYWSWLGILWEQRATMPFEGKGIVSDSLSAQTRATQAYMNAAKFAPFDPLHPVKLSDLYAAMGDTENARGWAIRALELDKNLRLDPLRQLTESERARLKAR
jgi:uncharacterized membrane protein